MTALQDKVALISGGTSGIGAATARLFQAEGATVVATGSSDESVAKARETMPGIEFVVSDAGDAAAAETLVEHARAAHGCVDILFANAGTSRFAPIAEVDEQTFDWLTNLLLRGPYFLVKHAVAAMPDGGSVILTSSIAAIRGMPEQSVYSACKGALRSLGTSLAVELAPRKIRVNTIIPGTIDTHIVSTLGLTPEQSELVDQIAKDAPLGRTGQADEGAAAVLYFASDRSRFTTGAELRIDGGFSIR